MGNLTINGKAAGKTDMFLIDPESLTLVTDKDHALYDPRVNMPLDENLVRNVMAFGVKEPILVRMVGDKAEVVAGRQRTRAAVEANKRLKAEGKMPIRVRCVKEVGDEKDLLGVMVLENEARIDNTPMERAKLVKRMQDMGATDEECAITFSKPVSHIRQLLALFDCAPEVRKEVEAGRLSVSAAAKLAKLDPKDQSAALKEAEETHEAAKASGNAHKASKKIAVRHVKAASEKKRGVVAKAPAAPSKAPAAPSTALIKSLIVAGGIPAAAQEALAWVLDGTVTGCVADGLATLAKLNAPKAAPAAPKTADGTETLTVKRDANGRAVSIGIAP